MTIRCNDIINFLEEYAPVRLAEEWDNVGLLLGGGNNEIKRIMTCLDVTLDVALEAAAKNVDLLVSHHPLIFKGIKRINEDDFKGKILYKLIKSNIGVYSAHTNLDAATGGINDYLAGLLEIIEPQNIMTTATEKLFKIVIFVPSDKLDTLRDAMSEAGAGWIGNYSDCTFSIQGTGTFRPLEGTNPYIGSKGKLEKVEEFRLETIVTEGRLKKVVAAMIKAHPYEEVAYDVYPLELTGKDFGFGKIGSLKASCSLAEFVKRVKSKLNVDYIRLIGGVTGEVKKAAVFCGSFDESLLGIIKKQADVLVTGDIKYHTALDIAQMGMCVIDAGHFNTENIIVSRLTALLAEKFPEIEVLCNSVEKDPITIA